MNKLPVENAGALGVRREQPDHKCDFQLEIKRKPERDGKGGIRLRSETKTDSTEYKHRWDKQKEEEMEYRWNRINMTRGHRCP